MTKSILLISILVLAWIMPTQAGTTQVAPGFHHTCAITTEGQLLCWGSTRLAGSVTPSSNAAHLSDRTLATRIKVFLRTAK